MSIPPRTLTGLVHYQVEQALKDLAKAANSHEAALQELTTRIAALPVPPTLAQIQKALEATGSNPLNISGLITSSPPGPTTANPPAPHIPGPPATPPPGPPPGPGVCMTDLTKGQPAGVPAAPNLRWFRGNMGGVRVPGLPAVPGGSSDPSLVLSWFYDRYNPVDRASIRAAFHARNYTHFQLSWPDSAYGSPQSDIGTYVAMAQELTADGFLVGHFLSSKSVPGDSGGANPTGVGAIISSVTPVISALQAANVIPWASVGWELGLFLSPTDLQTLINAFAGLLVPGTNLYIHMQQGYMAWQQNGQTIADFWKPNVGKLTGCLYQRILGKDCAGFQDNLNDCLLRMAGNDFMPNDSGFGHPFDLVAYELTVADQFNSGESEAAGDAVGFQAVCKPAVTLVGHPGTFVAVQGFGNGCVTPGGARL